MIITFEHQGNPYQVNLSEPIDISIPLQAGADNPNCYAAEDPEFKTVQTNDFIGSVAQGGAVNYQTIRITPHGNGTHTECYGHISADPAATLNACLNQFHFLAQLITLEPTAQDNGDKVIQLPDMQAKFVPGVKAVLVRTLPNEREKRLRKYTRTNPPYFDATLAGFLCDQRVDHLLTDLPSIDREMDGGALKAHRAFWNMDGLIRKNCTITELVYLDNAIPDGLYLLNLQITSLEADASPSKPIIYKLVPC